MYPSAPDFTTAGQDAWWQIRSGADTVICSTNGRSFVSKLQALVGVTADGKWGANTSNAVLSLLRAYSASDALISGVQSEATLRRPGVWSVGAGVWLIHSIQVLGAAPMGVAFADITIPSNLVPPQWNTAAPGSTNADPTCVTTGGSAVPTNTVPVVPATVPNIPPGVTDISPIPGLPTGLGTGDIFQTGDSASPGVVLAIVAGLAVIGGLAWIVTTTPQTPVRRRPR